MNNWFGKSEEDNGRAGGGVGLFRFSGLLWVNKIVISFFWCLEVAGEEQKMLVFSEVDAMDDWEEDFKNLLIRVPSWEERRQWWAPTFLIENKIFISFICERTRINKEYN